MTNNKKTPPWRDEFPDDVDFVYIDGNHSYEFVKKDIELYYPKVRNGGILGGHDFNLYGVAKAVVEFIDKNNLKLCNSKTNDKYKEVERFIDWWIVKP